MASIKQATTVNVLCKLWFEDNVWNGVAQDLPVAVFGETFEQAKANLLDAVVCHLQASSELGNLDQVLRSLQMKEHEILALDELPPHAALVRVPVVANDGQILAVNP
jgi:hypothetical protein